MSNPKYTYVCGDCGRSDALYIDVAYTWDFDEQVWNRGMNTNILILNSADARCGECGTQNAVRVTLPTQ